MEDREFDVAIVGGGAAGVLAATHLLERGEVGRIALVERSPRVGRGPAYGTEDARHLLNVPAGRLSAWSDAPDDFVAWLRETFDDRVDGAAFVPRRLYGSYLEGALERARTRARGRSRLDVVRGVAEAVSRDRGALRLSLRGGEELVTSGVVLALGDAPPRNPPIDTPEFYERSESYVADPWAERALEPLAGRDVLLLGMGLTGVDVALTLAAHGARLHAVSRHGLLPQGHRPVAAGAAAPVFGRGEGLGSLVRAVRRAAAEGADWRATVDGLRAGTQRIWQGLTPAEQDRFLRHAFSYWKVHRHRMPPATAAGIDGLVAAGTLRMQAGLVVAAADEPGGGVTVYIRPRGSDRIEELHVDAVVNCTGGRPRLFDGGEQPLLRSLVAAGLGRPDVHGIGLDTAADGALLDLAGAPSHELFALGALRRGTLLESTAIPELRAQAEQLAQTLAATVGAPAAEAEAAQVRV